MVKTNLSKFFLVYKFHEFLVRLTVTDSGMIMKNNYENLNIQIFAVLRLFVFEMPKIFFHIQRQEFVLFTVQIHLVTNSLRSHCANWYGNQMPDLIAYTNGFSQRFYAKTKKDEVRRVCIWYETTLYAYTWLM